MRYLLAFFALLPGCIRDRPPESQLWARAAFDMQCRQENLTIHEIDRQVRGVTGCGQQRTYVAACASRGSCTWVANDATYNRPAYPAPPGPYAPGPAYPQGPAPYAPGPAYPQGPAPYAPGPAYPQGPTPYAAPAGNPAPASYPPSASYPGPAPAAPKAPDAGGAPSTGR